MQPQLFILANGLRVILIDTKAFPTMTTVLFFGAGSRYENEKNNGIAHFLEHMVFKGSKKYPDFFTISSVLEGLGAVHNAFTSKDHTGFWVKSPTEHFEKVIGVLGDIIQYPLLAEEEIEKEKGVIVQEMNMYEDTPMRKVGEYFEQLLYPRSSLGMDVIGKKETVAKFQRQIFVDYMRQFYHPKNAVLVIAGGLGLVKKDITPDSVRHFLPVSAHSSIISKVGSLKGNETHSYKLGGQPSRSLRAARNPSMSATCSYYLKIIEEKFANFEAAHPTRSPSLRLGISGREGAQAAEARILKVLENQKKPEMLIHYKKTEQTHLSIGFRAFSLFDKRRYALSVLTTILGGGASSRLFIEVRERRGLCYYIHTGREHYHDVGYMCTQAGVPNNLETIKKTIDTILLEHKKISRGEVKKEELIRAKEIIKGRVLLSMEDSANVASWYGTKQILEGTIEKVDEAIKKIEAVTGEEVAKLADEIFRQERLNLALIGPFQKTNFHKLFTDFH